MDSTKSKSVRPGSDGKDIVAGAVLALAAWLVYCVSPNATSFDSRWTVHTATSILTAGDTDLNEFDEELAASGYYMVECVEPGGNWRLLRDGIGDCAGEMYHFYPVAVPLLASPAVGVMNAGLAAVKRLAGSEAAPPGTFRRLLEEGATGAPAAVEIVVASGFVAFASFLVFLTARSFLPLPPALLLGAVFAFCTPAWSLASRALWMHGPSMTLLALALLLLVRGWRSPHLVTAAGAVLALAFFVRPTNAVAAAVLTLYVFFCYRRQLPGYLIAAAVMSAGFAAYHYAVYGRILAPVLSARREGVADFALHDHFLQAVAANLLSPGRGLFVYFPAAALAVWALSGRFRREPAYGLRVFVAAICVTHLLLVSSFEDWTAGHAYGPRYMSDLVPYLVFLSIPVAKLAWERARERRFRLPVAAAVLIAASFWIHLQGATCWPCWEWNSEPVDVNSARERIWQWSDPAFLRGVRSGPPS